MILSLISAIDFPSWLREDIFTIGSFSLKWYGVGYFVGIYLAYFYAVRLTKRRDIWIPDGATRLPETVPNRAILDDLMIYCFLGIILGGRLGYVTLYSPETFLTPVEVLKIWEGGMSFHGGFLGVVFAGLYASWRHKIGAFRIGDMASVGAPIGLGIVRLFGNFINQELWGRPTDVPWAVRFPKDPDFLPRHPSQLYEAFLEGLILFLILRFLAVRYKALTKPGIIFGSLVFFYGLFRFSIEFVREPDATLFGPLTRGMAYSLPMIVVGAIIIIWAYRRAPVSPKRIQTEEK